MTHWRTAQRKPFGVTTKCTKVNLSLHQIVKVALFGNCSGKNNSNWVVQRHQQLFLMFLLPKSSKWCDCVQRKTNKCFINKWHFYQLGETVDIIIHLLCRVSKNYDIENKLVAFSADNAPVNFGSVHRKGDKNVLKQLKEQINVNMIGAGCTAHILHNAIETACDDLQIEVEYFAVKIYTYFYRHTVRLRTLKEFCDSVGQKFEKLRGYSKTRFLALKGCLSSIINNFDALNEYFHSIDAPKKSKHFSTIRSHCHH